jgi:hypothetical protein
MKNVYYLEAHQDCLHVRSSCGRSNRTIVSKRTLARASVLLRIQRLSATSHGMLRRQCSHSPKQNIRSSFSRRVNINLFILCIFVICRLDQVSPSRREESATRTTSKAHLKTSTKTPPHHPTCHHTPPSTSPSAPKLRSSPAKPSPQSSTPSPRPQTSKMAKSSFKRSTSPWTPQCAGGSIPHAAISRPSKSAP